MQPLPRGEQWVCKRKEKSTAGAGPQVRASGDRLFFLKCAEGEALSRRTWKALAFTSHARDGSRMAETGHSVGYGQTRFTTARSAKPMRHSFALEGRCEYAHKEAMNGGDEIDKKSISSDI